MCIESVGFCNTNVGVNIWNMQKFNLLISLFFYFLLNISDFILELYFGNALYFKGNKKQKCLKCSLFLGGFYVGAMVIYRPIVIKYITRCKTVKFISYSFHGFCKHHILNIHTMYVLYKFYTLGLYVQKPLELSIVYNYHKFLGLFSITVSLSFI